MDTVNMDIPLIEGRGRPTPMQLSVLKRIRNSTREALDPATLVHGVVTLNSATDAQQVGISFHEGGVTVTAGRPLLSDITCVVEWTDPEPPGDWPAEVPAGMRPLARQTSTLLHQQPAPEISDAAEEFWLKTRTLPGMVPGLVFIADRQQTIRVGDHESPNAYQIHGSDAVIRRICEGRSLYLNELGNGAIAVVGGLNDMSVMVGASMKVVLGED